MTDCGAVIYSRHNNYAGWTTDVSDKASVVVPLEDYVPKQAPRFQEHFVLQNNETGVLLAGVPYTIKTGDGKTIEGETDEQGRTEVVWTDSPWPVEVFTHPKPDDDTDPYHYDDNINYGGL